MKSKSTKRKRNSPALVQISFKVSPETAEQLDARATVVGVSRHRVARTLVTDSLTRREPTADTSMADASADLEATLMGIDKRLDDFIALCERLDERFFVQESRLAYVLQDLANGVFALLVQAGKAPDHAEAFVRNRLHLPPKAE